MVLKGDALAQVERILQSDCFQRSESLRRLLSYLAERSLSDDMGQLKEYAIGMDVFGKGKDYDTRLDSGVRIQVSRLRQKLADYYAIEDREDEIVASLPKGQFKLLFEYRPPGITEVQEGPGGPLPENAPPQSAETRWRRVAVALSVLLAAAILWGAISTVALRQANQIVRSETRWTPAMETFWRPFLQENRPLVVAVGAPLFVGLKGCCFYRDRNNGSWEETVQDPNFRNLRKTLNNPEIFAGHPYTSVGQAKAMLLVGTLLGRRIPRILFARSSDVSWQELSDSNALFVGSTKTFSQLLGALPVNREVTLQNTGLRVLHPDQGEPSFYPDPAVNAAGVSDGELHALISVLPGPNGKGFVGSFSATLGSGSFASAGASDEAIAASLGAGSLAAIEYATDPASVEELIAKLKAKDGHVPKYFQVALGVRFKGGIPTSSRFLLSREVRLEQTVTAER